MSREDIQIRIVSDPRLLASVRGLVRGYAKSQGFSADQADDVTLAVDEACSNSIRHAYHGRPTGLLELSLRSDNGCIEFVLCDHGTPAAPQRVQPQAPPTADPDALEPGGLGLRLIHAVFDDVEFSPGRERGNRVVMRLHRTAPGTDGTPTARRGARPEEQG